MKKIKYMTTSHSMLWNSKENIYHIAMKNQPNVIEISKSMEVEPIKRTIQIWMRIKCEFEIQRKLIQNTDKSSNKNKTNANDGQWF